MYSKIILPILMLLALICAPLALADEDYVVITNIATPYDTISKNTLRGLWLKKHHVLYSGQEAVMVGIEKGEARKGFLKQVVRKDVCALNSYWSRLLFSGKATPPVLLKNEQDVLEFVGETLGSVAYVTRGSSLPPTVKILIVE